MSDPNTLFITAARRKFRYESVRGDLTTEQLFDLPLTAANGFSLDDVARATNAELREQAEDSFVETRTNPRKGTLESMLEIVKFVIASKQADAAKAASRADRAAKRQKLLAAIESKDDAALSAASRDELAAELAKLDEAEDA